jgi:hypothetical protein
MKFSTLLTITFFIQIFTFSQTPTHTAPTLQVGLDGLAFGKGTLDSELILEIIAEKQGEIKLRVAQNILLEPLNDCGATIYSFGDNILKAVIEEKDPVVRKRKILESTVNTLFTIAFSSYYLNRVKTDTVLINQLTHLNQLAQLAGSDTTKLKLNDTSETIPRLPGHEKSNRPNKETNQLVFYTTILDISSEVIRSNKDLTALGILNVSYSKTFDYQSNYMNFPKELDSSKAIAYETAAKGIYDGMKAELDILTQLIGVTRFLINERNFRLEPKNLEEITLSQASSIPTIQNLQDKIKSFMAFGLTKTQASQIGSIYTYLDKLKGVTLNINEKSDIIYTLTNDFIPTLENSGISNAQVLESISMMRNLSKNYASQIITNPSLNKTVDALLKEENLTFFTNLLSRLYDLDKGNTYTEYFNLISEITNFLEQSPDLKNSKVKESLSYFNTFVKDYVIVNKSKEGKEYIDFSVESFLGHLADMEKNKPQRISFLFDVGVSTGYFVNKTFQLSDDIAINSISFVAEKIGLKWKFVNNGFWQRKSPGETYSYYGKKIKTAPPKQSVIDNVFLSVYGTGLLYNIFDVSTEKEFDSPFLGTALGIGFFNNLDLSLSVAVPVISNQSFSKSFEYPMLSINFDFRFNEYIQRLGEKRNAAQTQKALAKAEGGK